MDDIVSSQRASSAVLYPVRSAVGHLCVLYDDVVVREYSAAASEPDFTILHMKPVGGAHVVDSAPSAEDLAAVQQDALVSAAVF